MPKRDKGGISEDYFAGMPRGTMKGMGDPGKMIADFFKPKAKASKPQAMNRNQVEASAKSMGLGVKPDGSFYKLPKVAPQKPLAKKGSKSIKRNGRKG